MTFIVALPPYDSLLSTSGLRHKAMNEGQTRPFKPGSGGVPEKGLLRRGAPVGIHVPP